jgi:hypothetical protein
MALIFQRASFLMPANFNAMYGGALHCLGVSFDINEHEQCLLFPLRLFSDDEEEGVGVCWLSIPASVDVIDTFQAIASVGGNVVTTPIVKMDRLPSVNTINLPLSNGEMEYNLSISNFAATIRTESGLVSVTVTPAGFIKLTPQMNVAATAR